MEQLLIKRFPGCRLEWDEDPDLTRPGGALVWDGFEGASHVDRQVALGAYLREYLGADTRDIGTIFTLTPDELEFIRQAAD